MPCDYANAKISMLYIFFAYLMMKMMVVWNANSNEIIDAHHVRIVVTFNHSYHSCRNSRGGAEGGG